MHMKKKILPKFPNGFRRAIGSVFIGVIFLLSMNINSVDAQSDECEDTVQFEIDMGFDCWAIGTDCIVYYLCPPEDSDPIVA